MKAPRKEGNQLEELFLDELADMLDAEKNLIRALPKMAKAARHADLKEAFESHLQETEGHAEKVKQVFEAFDKPANGKKCEAIAGLIKEADEIAAEFKGSVAIDAALISAAQKVEHYEIASYGTLREWAGLLGNETAADLLQEILDEEENANESLTELARAHCNEEAMGSGGDSAAEEDDSEKTPAKAGLSKHSSR